MVDLNAAMARVSPLATVRSKDAEDVLAFKDLELTELKGRAVVQLFAKRGCETAVCEALAIGGLPGLATVNERVTAMPLAPGQWILTAAEGDDGSFAAHIRQQIDEAGYVSEQSQGRVIIRVTGKNARLLMQRGCRLDLHPTVTKAGFCAQTAMAQVGVLIHQLDEKPTYDLHVYSGFAVSFWHWLTTTAAQFGER